LIHAFPGFEAQWQMVDPHSFTVAGAAQALLQWMERTCFPVSPRRVDRDFGT
jgi:hypothetical protein